MPTCPTCNGTIPPGSSDCPRCRTVISGSGGLDATATQAGAPDRAEAPVASKKNLPERIAHFAIRRELGVGGMGAVYLAHDEKMNRDVALKVMSRAQSSDKAEARFEQEAWIAGRLDHPNIVKVYERGTWEGYPYFSMEVVDGGSLADVIANMSRTGRDDTWNLAFGSVPYLHWAIRMVVDAARGLDYAHRQRVVHRDIKPMNLLLSRELGAVKIADFGLAIDVEATRMTTVGSVMGTILFMAPEQIRGEGERIDGRTDVYALGVTLFELLTLELPYAGRTQQLYMSQVLTSEARRARSLNDRVSRDLETVIRKALEKRQADRYPSAAAFADDLDNVLHLRPITARPSGPWRRTTKWVQRKPVHAALAATLAVAIPVIGLVAERAWSERRAAAIAKLATLLDEARWNGEHRRFGVMRELAEAALGMAPDHPVALRHRAMAQFLGASAAASDAARDVLRASALVDASRIVTLLPGAAWPHAMKGFMLAVMKRTREAEAEDAESARLRGSTASDDDVGEDAGLAQARGDRKRAVALYSELIRRHPDSVRAIASRALIYEELGDADAAFTDYRVAAGLDPNYDLTLIDLARMSADRDKLDDAEGYLARAMTIDPDNAFALEEHGRLLTKRGREAKSRGDAAQASRLFEQSEAASSSAAKRSSGVVWAELNLATAVSERAKLQEPPDRALMSRAIEGYEGVLRRFAATHPGTQEQDVYDAALTNTCDAQLAIGRLQEAMATCKGLTERHPDSAVAFYNLAGAYTLLGKKREALDALAMDAKLGDRDHEYLAADPWFATLRSEPDFKAILAAMKDAHPPG
jgi:serine/threonine protein kinase/Flp pilus assembly protein TadD